MKRKLKLFSAIILAFICIITLTSCDNQINLYRDFNRHGSSLTKSHVYLEVSSKKIINILTEDKNNGTEDDKVYTYVFYGTPSNSASLTAIQTYNEQAKQFGIEVVYYLDSDLSEKELTKVRDAFGMKRPKQVPAIFVFINGVLEFDSTQTKYDDMATETIATKAFRDTK